MPRIVPQAFLPYGAFASACKNKGNHTATLANPTRRPASGPMALRATTYNPATTGNDHHTTVSRGGPYFSTDSNPRMSAPAMTLNCTRSEEHTSELQSHSFISYAVF